MTVTEATDWRATVGDTPVGLLATAGVVVVAGGEGRAVALDGTTGVIVASTEVDGGIVSCSVSPNGRTAVLSGLFGAWLWSLEDGSQAAVADGVWSSASAWISDRRVAVAGGRRVVVVDEGVPVWESDAFPSTVADVCWVGGHRRLAVAAYGGVHLIEPRPKAPVRVLPFKGSLLGLAATGNGRWLVSGNQDATLQVFRTDSDDRLEMSGYPGKIEHLAFDATGRFLANDGAPDVTVWDFGGPGPRGRSPVLVSSPEESARDAIGGFAWHPADACLAVGWRSGVVAEYEPRRGIRGHRLMPSRVVATGLPSVRQVAWSPDGKAVLWAAADGTVGRLRGRGGA